LGYRMRNRYSDGVTMVGQVQAADTCGRAPVTARSSCYVGTGLNLCHGYDARVHYDQSESVCSPTGTFFRLSRNIDGDEGPEDSA